jgi:hypothetical protein
MRYYCMLRAYNQAGANSTFASDGFTIDETPPHGGHVIDGLDRGYVLPAILSTEEISASWYDFEETEYGNDTLTYEAGIARCDELNANLTNLPLFSVGANRSHTFRLAQSWDTPAPSPPPPPPSPPPSATTDFDRLRSGFSAVPEQRGVNSGRRLDAYFNYQTWRWDYDFDLPPQYWQPWKRPPNLGLGHAKCRVTFSQNDQSGSCHAGREHTVELSVRYHGLGSIAHT